MSEPRLFSRGLSPRFMKDLAQEPLVSLLDEARKHGLDVHLRENYLSIYHRGGSALKLNGRQQGPHKSEIHERYLEQLDFPEGRLWGAYRVHDVDAAFVDAFVAQLPALLANIQAWACKRDGKQERERAAEGHLVRSSSSASSPLVFIDRQVQRHGRGVEGKHSGPLDLVGLTRERQPQLLLTEVKRGDNPDIPDLAEQLTDYHARMTRPDGYLRADVADAYAKVMPQREALGLQSAGIAFPEAPVEVAALIALCDYPPGCPLWPQAREALAQVSFPVRMFQTTEPEHRIPPVTDWEVIR